MKPKTRNINLGLIRSFVFFSVIAIHLFYNDFYSTPLSGTSMIIMIFIRTFFMICVPLFIILTGYLMRNKKISKS